MKMMTRTTTTRSKEEEEGEEEEGADLLFLKGGSERSLLHRRNRVQSSLRTSEPSCAWGEVSRVESVSLLSFPLLRRRVLSSLTESLPSSDYLLRAHDMNSVDPLICLLLAIAYVGRAFQRQCDNRNYCVVTVRTSFFPSLFFSFDAFPTKLQLTCSSPFFLQGMTFLDRYRKLHPDGEDADEVEYNFGTMFHRMGESRRLSFHFLFE